MARYRRGLQPDPDDPRQRPRAELALGRGRFLCPREGLPQAYRKVREYKMLRHGLNGILPPIARRAEATWIECQACLHRYPPAVLRRRPPEEIAARASETARLAVLALLQQGRRLDPALREAIRGELALLGGTCGRRDPRSEEVALDAAIAHFDAFRLESLLHEMDCVLDPDGRDDLLRPLARALRSGVDLDQDDLAEVVRWIGRPLGFTLDRVLRLKG